MSGQQHAPAALYPRERPGTHFTLGWVGPQGRSGRAENLALHRDSIPNRLARSQSLYRLSYRAHVCCRWELHCIMTVRCKRLSLHGLSVYELKLLMISNKGWGCNVTTKILNTKKNHRLLKQKLKVSFQRIIRAKHSLHSPGQALRARRYLGSQILRQSAHQGGKVVSSTPRLPIPSPGNKPGTYFCCGPGSSVGIATELRAGRSGIESRCGRDFPPVQTGPGARPVSCTMGTGSFPRVKRPGRDGDHPPLSSAEVKEYS